MALTLPPVPASLRPVQHFLKLATEHDNRDPVVAYWARLTALQAGLELDKSSAEALGILMPLMEWLETQKKMHKENDENSAVVNEVVASAHIENYAMKLFLYADKCDRAANFGKNVVKSFYSAGVLFDVMQSFGELTPEVAHFRKYAKMKAAYIHNCLKNGETPVAGPLTGEDDEESGGGGTEGAPAAPKENLPGGGGFVAASAPPPAPGPTPTPTPTPTPAHGGFTPAPPVSLPAPGVANSSGAASLSIEQTSRVQKLCKYAISALDYQDTNTAIDNLTKALHLCKTGQELD